jgi:UPF0716 protein FxsA
VRLKRGWPLLLLIALLLTVPILEVWIVIELAQQFGIWLVVTTLAITAVGGAILTRHEGARAWRSLTNAYTTGKVPTGHLADAALILVGGVLLMMPGYLTDVVGFLFLLRWTRPFVRKMIAFFVARRAKVVGAPPQRSGPGDSLSGRQPDGTPKRDNGPTIIPGEVEEST